jgi:hypothetical protein
MQWVKNNKKAVLYRACGFEKVQPTFEATSTSFL